MAVFTPIELDDISNWISQDFDIGQATEIRGIHGGIENSNFFLWIFLTTYWLSHFMKI
jgi:homoserine kinase type II